MKLFFTLCSSLVFAVTYTPESIQNAKKEATLVSSIEILSQETIPHSTFYAITLSRARILNSENNSFLTIVTPGGEREGRGTLFSGIPKPRVGKKYFAYLKPSQILPEKNYYEVSGFEEGLSPLFKERQYSRNRTDGSNGQGNGAFLYWDPSYLPIPYFISRNSFDGHADYIEAIDNSFKTWRDIEDIKIEFTAQGCSDARQNENDGINNIIFIKNNWNFDPAAIAITRNFFVSDNSSRSGLILDTDILLNGVHHQFTTTSELGKHDVQNILTHEIGHFLGLGHEVDPIDTSASMYAVAGTNETSKRSLKTSDLNGIHSAYSGVGDKLSAPLSRCEIVKTTPSCGSVHVPSDKKDLTLYFNFLISVLALIATLLLGKRSIKS